MAQFNRSAEQSQSAAGHFAHASDHAAQLICHRFGWQCGGLLMIGTVILGRELTLNEAYRSALGCV